MAIDPNAVVMWVVPSVFFVGLTWTYRAATRKTLTAIGRRHTVPVQYSVVYAVRSHVLCRTVPSGALKIPGPAAYSFQTFSPPQHEATRSTPSHRKMLFRVR